MYGTVYAADGGSGFSDEDFRAISNLALSSKPVGEGIGNKGIGFAESPSLEASWRPVAGDTVTSSASPREQARREAGCGGVEVRPSAGECSHPFDACDPIHARMR